MDKSALIILMENLYPVYKELLTPKMAEVLEMYFYDDLSLSEISEIKNISRNAIHTKIKNAISKMENLEKKLKIIKLKSDIKFELDNSNIADLRKNIREIIE